MRLTKVPSTLTILATFFRSNESGKFVHEIDVKNFLNLLVKRGEDNYPYSKEEYRQLFRHSL